MKKPVVFSLVREQSIFMTVIMALLTFLAVLALGVAISVTTGVLRWNSQWKLYATVQITDSRNINPVKKIIGNNKNKIEKVSQISDEQMEDLMRPWLEGNSSLKEYLPKMFELKFKNKSDLKSVEKQISPVARFLPHSRALKSASAMGWRLILVSGLILVLVLATIGVCISYIARNTAMLHRRELEILNQVGATDSFIVRQMQIIVAKICTIAAFCGFAIAIPFLFLIFSAASSARMGLMSMIGISFGGWWILLGMPVIIIVFSVWITRITTLRILKDER